MARVTVEDCLENVKNRFELVMIASKRARQLMRGSAEPKVAWENDKATVVALREIAMGYTDFSDAHQAEIIPHAPLAHTETVISIDMTDDLDDDLIEITEITEATPEDNEAAADAAEDTDTTDNSAPEANDDAGHETFTSGTSSEPE